MTAFVTRTLSGRPSASLDEALNALADAMARARRDRDALAWARRSRALFILRFGEYPAEPGHAAVLADLDARIARLERTP
jgi:hypothetical protein